jgi:hypothetical protein
VLGVGERGHASGTTISHVSPCMHADPFDGWDSCANLRNWLREGKAIALRLQDESSRPPTSSPSSALGATHRELRNRSPARSAGLPTISCTRRARFTKVSIRHSNLDC